MPAYDHSNLIRYAVADHVEEQHEEMGYSPKFRRGWSSSSVHYVFVMLGLAFCFAWINVFPTSFSSDKKMTPPFMHEREQESSFVLNKILGSLRFLVERPRCSLLLYSCGKKSPRHQNKLVCSIHYAFSRWDSDNKFIGTSHKIGFYCFLWWLRLTT